MIKQIVDVSQRSWLHLKNRQLCVEQNDHQIARIPVEDLGFLILAHPAISISQAVIIACQENNAVIIFCDRRHLPYSIILPISEGHSLHHKILQRQIAVTKPTKNRIWQQIVREKILQQEHTLQLVGKPTIGFNRFRDKVKSGDPENIEAQAAKRYWRLLFGDKFRRDQSAGGVNALLNYGYSIIRALIARAIVGGGLHPTIGINHANQYNSLCLADDLMEPLRPWVDALVFQMTADHGVNLEICSETKHPFFELLSNKVRWAGKSLPLMVASHHYISTLKRCYVDKSEKMDFMQWNRNQIIP